MKSLQLSALSILACAMVSPAASPLQFTNISAVIQAPPNDLFAVTHDGAKRFVAVGAKNQALAGNFVDSQPFIASQRWAASIASGPTANLLGVAASSNLFVASGDKNIFFTSTSGTNFLAGTGDKIFTTRVTTEGLAFDANTFVAVAKAPQISRVEYNGTTLDLLGPNHNKWSPASSFVNLSYVESFRDVATVDGGFVACGAFGVVRKSVNAGKTWTLLRPGGTREPSLLGIAAHGNVLVSVGKPGTGNGGVILTSQDAGRIWSKKTVSGPLNDVAYNGSDFVAVGKGGLVLISSNGVAWDTKPAGEVQSTRDLNGLAFVTNGFLQGIGLVVGAKDALNRATVLLAGVSPQTPVIIRNDALVCAGSNSPIIVSITNNNLGPGLIAAEWFMQGTGALITNGLVINEWKLLLETNLAATEFTLRPVLQTSNLADPNHATVFNFQARAVDIRTGFVSERTNISHVVFPRPTAMVSGSTNICNGQPATVLAELTGLGPWQITWASNGVVLPSQFVPSNNPVVLATRTETPFNPESNMFFLHAYTVTNLVDLGSPLNCAANVLSNDLRGTAVVTNFPRPTATVVSGGTNICNGQPATIIAELTGLGPWQIIWASNGVVLPAQFVSSHAPPVLATRIETPFSPELNAPFVHAYTVSGLVDLGSPLNCAAAAGDLLGTAIVTNFPRPTATLSGSTNICNGQSVTIQAELTGLGPWLITWASNGVAFAPQLVPSNSSPVFTTRAETPFSPASNSLFLHAYTVANLVDLGSPLLCPALLGDLGQAAIVTNAPRPTAVVTGSTNICNGQSATIQAELTGLGPWQITWVSNGVVLPALLVPSNAPVVRAPLPQTPVSPESNTLFLHVYSVTNLVDMGSSLNCQASAGDLSGTFTVTNFPRPTAMLVSPNTTICNGESNVLEVSLTGLLPLTIRWQDGVQQTSNSYLITRTVAPTNTSLGNALITNYWVASVVNSNVIVCRGDQPGDILGTNQVIINPRARAFVVTTNTICNGDSAQLQVNLGGQAPWTIIWSDGFEQTNILVSPVFRTVTPTNQFANTASNFFYSVINVSDSSTCLSTAGDIAGVARITVNPLPTGTITSGDTNIYHLTFGGGQTKSVNVKVVLALTGIGPWDVTWSDGVDAFNRTYSSSPATNTFTVVVRKRAQETNFTFSVLTLNAGNCAGQTNGLTAVANVNPRPGAEVSGTNTICYGDSAQIFADLSGKGPWDIRWSDGAVSNNVATNFVVRTLPASTFSNLAISTVYTFTITNLTDQFTNTSDTANDLTGEALITVYPVATNPPISLGNVANCAGETAELKVSVPDGFTVDWFADAGQTVQLLSGSTNLFTNAPAGTNVYYAAVRFNAPDATNSICYFPASTGITNVVYPVPTSPPISLGNVTNCVGEVTQLVVSVQAGFTVDWFADDARTVLIFTNSTSLPVKAEAPGTNSYFAAVRFNAPDATNSICYFPTNAGVIHAATDCDPPEAIALSPNGMPVLSMTKNGATLTLQWSGDSVLQKCTDLVKGKWVNVQSGVSEVLNTCTLAATSGSGPGSAFFRLVPNNSK